MRTKKSNLVLVAVSFTSMLALFACAGGNAPNGTCKTNGDCTGEDICEDGECVPMSANGGGSQHTFSGPSSSSIASSSTASSSTASSSSSTGGGCTAATGESCGVDSDCCAYPNALCENFEGIGSLCSATCSSGSDCESGCCTPDSSNRWTCSPADYCTPSCKGGVGTPCTTQGDCCQVDTNGDVCVGAPLNACTAACTTSSECESHCCVQLQDGNGACISNSTYPCLP